LATLFSEEFESKLEIEEEEEEEPPESFSVCKRMENSPAP
jgi:hypothetical protein